MEAIDIIPKEDRIDHDTVRESKIEGDVCKHAKKLGGFYVRKYVTPGNASSPDRIFIEHENRKIKRLFFIEFKAPGKKPTAAQLEEHDLMRSCGITVYSCVDNVEHGKAILEGLC